MLGHVHVFEQIRLQPHTELLQCKEVERGVVELVPHTVHFLVLGGVQLVETWRCGEALKGLLGLFFVGLVSKSHVGDLDVFVGLNYPRSTSGNDLLRLFSNDFFGGDVAGFRVEDVITHIVATSHVDQLAEVAFFDCGTAVIPARSAPEERLGLLVSFRCGFFDAIYCIGPVLVEGFRLVFLIKDLSQQLNGLGGVGERMLTEVGDYVLNPGIIHFGEHTVGFRGFIVVGGHDHDVRVVGQEIFYSHVPLSHIADFGDVFCLWDSFFQFLVEGRCGCFQVGASGNDFVERLVFVQN